MVSEPLEPRYPHVPDLKSTAHTKLAFRCLDPFSEHVLADYCSARFKIRREYRHLTFSLFDPLRRPISGQGADPLDESDLTIPRTP